MDSKSLVQSSFGIFTHKSQEGFELSQHHSAIFIFVVQFAQFNKVVVVSSVFWLLNNLLGKSDNLIEGKEFLFNIISLAIFDTSLLGEVHAHGVEDIHEVVHVKDTLAVPIVDVADPLNFFNVERHDDFVSFKRLSDSYTDS